MKFQIDGSNFLELPEKHLSKIKDYLQLNGYKIRCSNKFLYADKKGYKVMVFPVDNGNNVCFNSGVILRFFNDISRNENKSFMEIYNEIFQINKSDCCYPLS